MNGIKRRNDKEVRKGQNKNQYLVAGLKVLEMLESLGSLGSLAPPTHVIISFGSYDWCYKVSRTSLG